MITNRGPTYAEGAGRAFTRRQALTLATSLAAAGGFAGCQVQTEPTSTTSGPAADYEIVVPDAKAAMPSEDVTFRTMLSDGSKVLPPIFEAIEEKHPNITIDDPETTWDTINEAVTLGVRNGTAPDLFSRPTTVPNQVAVSEGWAAALEDIVPDFETWKANQPETHFIPGVHVFDGKTYGWTSTSNYSQYGYYVFYNQEMMNEADFDPQSEPLTWSGFRQLAKKLTSADDDRFGLMLTGARMGAVALHFAERAGLAGREMNYQTGEYQYADERVAAALELLLSMKEDGSLFPGTLNLTHDLAISKMGEGNTGMQLDGSWNIAKWKVDNPDFVYGVAMPPTGDDGEFHHASFAESVSSPWMVYAESEHKDVAGEILSYFGSVEGQVAMTMMSEGALVSVMPEANMQTEEYSFPEPVQQYRTLSKELLAKAPLAQFVNPDVNQVVLETKPVKPSLGDIAQGALSGQIDDLQAALQKLEDDSNRGLDDAIAAANKKGAKVSREDYVFPNWDPEQDYSVDDYDQR